MRLVSSMTAEELRNRLEFFVLMVVTAKPRVSSSTNERQYYPDIATALATPCASRTRS
jgi:hypothetical protein